MENNNLLPPGQVALLFNSMSVGYMVGARDWNNHDFVRKCTSERKRDHVELYMKRVRNYDFCYVFLLFSFFLFSAIASITLRMTKTLCTDL